MADEQQAARQRAEQGIAALVPDALAVIAGVLRETKAQRNAAVRAAAARYVLDVVLGLPASEERQNSEASGATQMVPMTPNEAMRELRRRLTVATTDSGEPAG